MARFNEDEARAILTEAYGAERVDRGLGPSTSSGMIPALLAAGWRLTFRSASDVFEARREGGTQFVFAHLSLREVATEDVPRLVEAMGVATGAGLHTIDATRVGDRITFAARRVEP